MKIKIFTPDADGKISFTKKELEELLNEVYSEGKRDGYCYYPTTTTTPSPLTPYYSGLTISNAIDTATSTATLEG